MSESQPDLLVIGRISGCYGIKGWVKIHSFTEPVENMLAYDQFQLKRKSGLEAVEFDSIRRQGKGLVGHIKGVDDRNLAETYKGLEIAVGAEQLPTLDDGDFYWRELHGLKVWCLDQSVSEERVLLGTVDHLIDTGANDVLVVKACKESVDKQERLIPYLPDDVVTRVDLKAGLIEVDWFLEV
ncbi:MAG: 16S rRNA processing protein RimM [Halioglobus sp.]|jgi:16S rRNA processing protein RimM